MREIAEPGAAPFFFNGNSEQSPRPELWPQLAGKGVGAVDIVGARRNLVFREATHSVAKHFDIAAKTEIESRQAVPQHRSLPGGRGAKATAKRRGQMPRRIFNFKDNGAAR